MVDTLAESATFALRVTALGILLGQVPLYLGRRPKGRNEFQLRRRARIEFPLVFLLVLNLLIAQAG